MEELFNETISRMSLMIDQCQTLLSKSTEEQDPNEMDNLIDACSLVLNDGKSKLESIQSRAREDSTRVS
jgi:hypothetical protein